MRAFNIAVVIVLILVGAGLLVLTVLAYRRTGNALLIIYGSIIAIGMVSGAFAAWWNLRQPPSSR
jgi:hypothetical protein